MVSEVGVPISIFCSIFFVECVFVVSVLYVVCVAYALYVLSEWFIYPLIK